MTENCTGCYGTGKCNGIRDYPCPNCMGSGKLRVPDNDIQQNNIILDGELRLYIDYEKKTQKLLFVNDYCDLDLLDNLPESLILKPEDFIRIPNIMVKLVEC